MDIFVRSSAELKGAFASANDGDVIKLAPGDYGSTLLRGRDFNTDVTITSVDSGNRAVFDNYLEFNDVSGVTLKNVDIDASALAGSAAASRIQIIRSQDVTLRDISVEGHVPTSSEDSSGGRLAPHAGYGYENGMRLRWTDNVTLKNVEFSDVRQALSISDDSNNTTISNVNVHDVREGINLNDANGTVIEDSWFHDFKPYRGDHPDMIQYWGTDSGVQGLTVRNNLLDQSDGWTQSIFGHFNGRPDYVTGSDFVITGNTIINGHPNAIRIREIDGFKISDNVLLPNDPNYDYRRLPQITLLDSKNGEVSENFLLPRWDGSIVNLSADALRASNIDLSDNVSLSTDAGSEVYWASLLNGNRPVAPSSNEEENVIEEPAVEENVSAPDDLAESEEPQVEQLPDGDESLDGQEVDPTEGDNTPVVEDELVDAEPETVEAGLEDDSVPTNVTGIDVSQIDIVGTSRSDLVRDRSGDTSLSGLDGSDRFLFDYRKDTGSAHDILVDLDFAGGDRLILVGNKGGTFDDSADPENNLMVLNGGSRVHIRNEDDLREAAASGGITLGTSDDGESLIVTLGEAPDRSIELLGISPDEFFV